MWVICLDNQTKPDCLPIEGHLTVGKQYEVFEIEPNTYRVVNDKGRRFSYRKERFQIVEVDNMIMKAQVFDEKDTREFKVSTSKTEEALDAMKAIVTCADSDQVLFRWMVKGKWVPVTIRKSDGEWEDKLTQAFKDFVDKVKEVYAPASSTGRL